jgi:hypothetical protein
MDRRLVASLIMLALCTAAGVSLGGSGDTPPQHALPPPARPGEVVVGLCDGKTTAVMKVAPGEQPSREQAQAVADQLMAEWRRKSPSASWDDTTQLAQVEPAQPGGAQPNAAEHGGSARPGEQAQPGAGTATQPGTDVELQRQGGAAPPARQGAAEGAPQAGARIEGGAPGERAAQGETAGQAGGKPAGPQGPVQEGQTYGAFSERDERIWQAATDTFVAEGKRIFHSSDALGGTIAVSCDMCHPDAANTHPETYPKYQVQFQRVALLRDMINWCIENPVRGQPLPDDDPRLKALEAYILAQRKGVALDYGKH